jgi:hypothetical protein
MFSLLAISPASKMGAAVLSAKPTLPPHSIIPTSGRAVKSHYAYNSNAGQKSKVAIEML